MSRVILCLMTKKSSPSKSSDAKQPVKPRGKAKPLSSEELNAATSAPAMRSATDRAIADWKKNAPAEFRGMLDAKPKT